MAGKAGRVAGRAERERARYNTDTLTITLRDARVKESDEVRPGVIADFGYDGGVVGFEILQASKVVEQAGEWSRQGAPATYKVKRRG
jgi:uncharacterized protein YuzE